ncbi:MAG: polysaccharide pyruvyl transferase CsaB [Clostridiales bacterium]|nr:polysaccharide pyruvyl transferase CsaB [Clostridiales bacterium]
MIKVLHIIGGGDKGGAKPAVISLLSRIRKYVKIKLVSFRSGVFSDEAISQGIDVEIIEIKNPIEDLRRLKAVCEDFSPDIVHCHGARANMMGVMLKHSCRKPLVTTLHSDYKRDYMGRSLVGKLYGAINACMLPRIDYYTCVSDKTARLMISRGFNASSMFVIYNGIDFDGGYNLSDRKAYLESLGCDYKEGDIIVGIAARLTAVKDVPTLLRAFKEAKEEAPRLKLVIAGDGEDRQMLENLARELKIDKYVTFAGWISSMREYFASIDINVICSVSEAFPYSVLEGIRERCATVVSNVGGLPEVVTDSVDGYIMEPGDYETLGDRLAKLANDDELRKTMADKLYEKASDKCSLDRMALDQFEIYKTVLRRHPDRKKRRGVTICGAYGKGNAGDDAILDAILAEMREIDRDMPITVMSKDSMTTKLRYRVDSVYTFNIFKAMAAFRRSKLYINGGGSLIQDITSSRSLYFYLWTLFTAKSVGCNVMMYGCGIGPVRKAWNRKISAFVINKNVDMITLREDGSREELKRLGVNKPDIILSADPTLNLSPAPEEQIRAAFEKENIPHDGKYLCLCMRPWQGFDKIVESVAAAGDYAFEKYGLETVILPIELPRDDSVGKQVAKNMKHKPYVVKNRYDSAVTIGMLQRMSGVIGMRLHSLVFASIVSVPSAGVIYDMKVEGFMRYIGQNRFCTLEEASNDTLKRFVDDLAVCDREELRRNIEELRAKAKKNISKARKLLGK